MPVVDVVEVPVVAPLAVNGGVEGVGVGGTVEVPVLAVVALAEDDSGLLGCCLGGWGVYTGVGSSRSIAWVANALALLVGEKWCGIVTHLIPIMGMGLHCLRMTPKGSEYRNIQASNAFFFREQISLWLAWRKSRRKCNKSFVTKKREDNNW